MLINTEEKKRLLLHTCCAPCSPHVIQLLGAEFRVTAYFYNPNIHPYGEYQRRLDEMQRLCSKISIEMMVGNYDAEEWFERMAGMEAEKEGGRRCERCYYLRLEKTADLAEERGFSHFTTTLTVSPHKKASTINRIGRELREKGPAVYYQADFKKGEGFKKSCELARQYGLYRQNYCGCVYSRRR